jgi:glutathione synthase/RimK-type ligase-like ATP-grasp enzyme
VPEKFLSGFSIFIDRCCLVTFFLSYVSRKTVVIYMGKEINKLDNAQLLAQNEDVAPHLPEYHRLSWESLRSMLRKYPVVYAKPVNSCQGKGVMRVERVTHGYVLKPRDVDRTYRLRTLTALYQTIQRLKMPRMYLLQQGIPSYTVNGRLFDIRTHLLRIDGEWQIGAIIGRVATARGVATNAYSGGKPVPILVMINKNKQIVLRN